MQQKLDLATTLRMLMDSRVVRGKPISANELSRRTKVPQSTITRILNGDVKEPRNAQLQPIADFFAVSLTELRGESQAKVIGPQRQDPANGEPRALAYVSVQEMDLLIAYRSSNDVGRKAIVATVLALAKQSPVTTSSNVRKLR